MSRDAAKGAAVALRRYAREQEHADDAPFQTRAGVAALSVTRGEAARAVEAAGVATAGTRTPEQTREHVANLLWLRGSAPIPSATLTTWVDGWDAYAAREVDPGEPEGSETPPCPLPMPDGCVMP